MTNGMKPKTKQMVDLLMADPKLSQTEAYIRTHRTTNRNVARSEASKTLSKPSIQIYMKKHTEIAKRRIVALTGSEKQDVALRAAQDILDRTYGKATQKQESQSINLNLNVEASDELAQGFEAYMKSSTAQK